jgi:hypothetical protein
MDAGSPMAKGIWKFVLPSFEHQVMMPAKSQVVHVGQQDGAVVVWAVVDPRVPDEPRRFFTVATGQPFPTDQASYLGTVQMPSGLVWHVLEVTG